MALHYTEAQVQILYHASHHPLSYGVSLLSSFCLLMFQPFRFLNISSFSLSPPGLYTVSSFCLEFSTTGTQTQTAPPPPQPATCFLWLNYIFIQVSLKNNFLWEVFLDTIELVWGFSFMLSQQFIFYFAQYLSHSIVLFKIALLYFSLFIPP